jgi:hypothetical protein
VFANISSTGFFAVGIVIVVISSSSHACSSERAE